MAILIGGLVLLREHWGHTADYLPYALLLACPLMHLLPRSHGDAG